ANFGMFFGGGDRERPNLFVTLALMFIMPMAATIIQMTVSRNREFMADEGSAKMTGHPEWLQSALAKLDNYARGTELPEADPQTAHMFIINPFSGKDISLSQLFATHPSTEQRIERLEALK
ncbi:MAG TPA: protease, partial [Epsilonproteobacteria bacterium]|nr:protease [Campylobacterota bacterium]